MSRIGVVGGGAMASAIITGALEAGLRQPAGFLVADPADERRDHFATMGIPTTPSSGSFANDLDPGDPILLAVKPQMLARVAQDLRQTPMEGRLVVSILAGATSATIRSALPSGARIVRVMPNTPAQVALGATAIARGAGATDADIDFAMELFAALGKTFFLDEMLIDAFTAVAGSGPAYVFYLAEAMNEAASTLGLSPDEVGDMVAQTVLGAATLLAGQPHQASELRRRVTSPGGTTAAAIDVLEARHVSTSIVEAISAARDRGRELAGGD